MISVTPGGGVKDPADQVTAELPGLVPKRGRGRPRKVDALSAAQRAQRYRDRQKAAAAERERAAAGWKFKYLRQHPSRIRYRGPNGETWSGRGQRPRWIVVFLERGGTLAQLETWAGNGHP